MRADKRMVAEPTHNAKEGWGGRERNKQKKSVWCASGCWTLTVSQGVG